MSVNTRPASTSDLPFLGGADTHLPPDRLAELVSAGRVMGALLLPDEPAELILRKHLPT